MTRAFWVVVFGLPFASHAAGADEAFDRAKARAEKVGAEIKKPTGSEFYEHLFFDFSKATDDDIVAIVDHLKKAKPESKVKITDVYLGPAHSDAALKNLAELDAIELLDARKTKVTDKGLEPVGTLRKLKVLRLFQTGITDEGLKHLTGLKDMHYLDLEDIKVTDAGLKHLMGLDLKTLKAKGTKVTAEGAKLFKSGVVER
jgi:hypothetical protein